jgi:hypothetical protein
VKYLEQIAATRSANCVVGLQYKIDVPLTQLPIGTMDLKEVVGRMWAGFALQETERMWSFCEYGNDPASLYATGIFFIICLAISWNLRNCFAVRSQIVRILIWVNFLVLPLIIKGPCVAQQL